jgi:anti-sigma B factor antagonist/stage II sporulation protein AA (anti-sigma F factor antagonist)
MIEVVNNNGNGRPAVRGELDISTVPALEAWLAQLDGELTEVDLSGVTFFDSSALRTFLVARRDNARLRVINPSERVVKVLEITGMLDYLTRDPEVDR